MQCFKKTLLFAFGKSLRALFVTLLINREITNVETICDIFATYFCDNLPYQLKNWPNIPKDLTSPYHDYGLYLPGKPFKKLGKTLGQCGLSLPTYTWRPDNSLL